jgi:ethanolamine ammonia-lyase large subunit
VKNEVVHGGKEQRDILPSIKINLANWIGHILCRNCVLQHVIEGKIEAIGRGGRRRRIYWMIAGK